MELTSCYFRLRGSGWGVDVLVNRHLQKGGMAYIFLPHLPSRDGLIFGGPTPPRLVVINMDIWGLGLGLGLGPGIQELELE